MMKDRKSSRLSGFYNRSLDERLQIVGEWAGLSETDLAVLRNGLSAEQADHMIENALGTFALPLGVGVNFLVNGHDILCADGGRRTVGGAAVRNAGAGATGWRFTAEAASDHDRTGAVDGGARSCSRTQAVFAAEAQFAS